MSGAFGTGATMQPYWAISTVTTTPGSNYARQTPAPSTAPLRRSPLGAQRALRSLGPRGNTAGLERPRSLIMTSNKEDDLLQALGTSAPTTSPDGKAQ
jgi:hypothetical protein